MHTNDIRPIAVVKRKRRKNKKKVEKERERGTKYELFINLIIF